MISEIAVIGCGGTGSWLVPPLLRYLNSIKFNKDILLVDGDSYEINNLNRQEFPSSLVGSNKAMVLTRVYQQRYPDLKIKPVNEYIGENNKDDIFIDNSVIFSAIDNNKGRNIFINAALTVKNIALILPGNNKDDGDVQILWRVNNKTISKNPIDLHPEILSVEDGDRSKMSCEELSKIKGSEQIIFANLTAATVALTVFYNIYNCIENSKKINIPSEIFFDLNGTIVTPRYY